VAEDPDRSRPLVIGLGTDARSDDGVGLDVVRALRRDPVLRAEIVEGPGDLSRLLDLWSGRAFVVLVDAVRSGAAPGTIVRWDGGEAAHLPSGISLSTHGLSLTDILHLAGFLERLPTRLVVFGIEARETGVGTVRSPEVREAVPEVCRRIAREVADRTTSAAPPPREEAPYA
jgi:hydrogenase maturation protease